MDIDLTEISAFMTTHARLIDRRRFDLITGQGSPQATLSALLAYQNPDGGYGWALEPDLRSPESQPAGALHAFEFFEEIGPEITTEHALRLCDWLTSTTLPDGGLPFALPLTQPTGSASFWAQADHTHSSLHITTAVADMAHRVAWQNPAVRNHEWLNRATDYCLNEIAQLNAAPHAIAFRFILGFLDALHETRPDVAAGELQRLGKFLPPTGTMPVEGGKEGEAMHPLDFSPWPNRPLRALFSPDSISTDLQRLRAQQQDDGGWIVDFASASVAGSLEWRGYATAHATKILRAH